MNKDSCYNLGKIVKLHGLKGDVVIYLDVDDPEEYLDLESVFVEINQKLVPFFIEQFTLTKGKNAIVRFEDVTFESASSLVNQQLFLPEQNLPELEGDQFYFHEIVGYTVNDKNLGNLGKVTGVVELPGHDLLQMEYNNKEVLLPLHEDFILRADKDQSVLYTDLPEGLIDLYLNESSSKDRDDGDED